MKVTATNVMATPTITLTVSDSPKNMVPTAMAVTGSKTPSTDVLVAPITRVAIANVRSETNVGKIARPARFAQQNQPWTPLRNPPPLNALWIMNNRDPVSNA